MARSKSIAPKGPEPLGKLREARDRKLLQVNRKKTIAKYDKRIEAFETALDKSQAIVGDVDRFLRLNAIVQGSKKATKVSKIKSKGLLTLFKEAKKYQKMDVKEKQTHLREVTKHINLLEQIHNNEGKLVGNVRDDLLQQLALHQTNLKAGTFDLSTVKAAHKLTEEKSKEIIKHLPEVTNLVLEQDRLVAMRESLINPNGVSIFLALHKPSVFKSNILHPKIKLVRKAAKLEKKIAKWSDEKANLKASAKKEAKNIKKINEANDKLTDIYATLEQEGVHIPGRTDPEVVKAMFLLNENLPQLAHQVKYEGAMAKVLTTGLSLVQAAVGTGLYLHAKESIFDTIMSQRDRHAAAEAVGNAEIARLNELTGPDNFNVEPALEDIGVPPDMGPVDPSVAPPSEIISDAPGLSDAQELAQQSAQLAHDLHIAMAVAGIGISAWGAGKLFQWKRESDWNARKYVEEHKTWFTNPELTDAQTKDKSKSPGVVAKTSLRSTTDLLGKLTRKINGKKLLDAAIVTTVPEGTIIIPNKPLQRNS